MSGSEGHLRYHRAQVGEHFDTVLLLSKGDGAANQHTKGTFSKECSLFLVLPTYYKEPLAGLCFVQLRVIFALPNHLRHPKYLICARIRTISDAEKIQRKRTVVRNVTPDQKFGIALGSFTKDALWANQDQRMLLSCSQNQQVPSTGCSWVSIPSIKVLEV